MDVRQQRSQERLFAAALRLAADEPVAGLTVSGIAREAGVHRSTFYELAGSPAELVGQALLTELDALRAGLLDDEETPLDVAVTAVTRGVLDHLARYAGIYRRGLADDSGPASLHPMLARHFRETSWMLVERSRMTIPIDAPGFDPERITDTAIRFLAMATVGAMEAWLASDELDVDEFLGLYVQLVPDWWPKDLTTAVV